MDHFTIYKYSATINFSDITWSKNKAAKTIGVIGINQVAFISGVKSIIIIFCDICIHSYQQDLNINNTNPQMSINLL